MFTATVTFKEGSKVLAAVRVGNGGLATFTTSTLAPGHHLITAVYSGDANYGASTSPPA